MKKTAPGGVAVIGPRGTKLLLWRLNPVSAALAAAPRVTCPGDQPHAMAVASLATHHTEHPAATPADARCLHGHVARPPTHLDLGSPDLPPTSSNLGMEATDLLVVC